MIRTLMRFVATLAVVVAVSACDDDPVVTVIPAPGGAFAFITTTDFQTGSSSVVWTGNSIETNVAVASIHSDAVARFAGGRVYVVNRFGADNIQILDPANAFATTGQFSVGNGADPHDIAVVSASKAYVTRYNETDLWIVNPSTGAQIGTISLAALADGDGVPEMDQLYLSGNRLFVSVQRIDRNTDWNPVGTSFLAVVDVDADSLLDTDPGTGGVQSIALGATNPFSAVAMDATTGNLYMACAGDWGVADGGVESVDPVTMESAGILLTGASAGGDVTDAVVVDGQTAYAIMTDATFSNKLLRFNPSTGAVTDTVYAPGAFVLNDVELSPDGTLLFLTDRTATAPGIRIYDAQSGDESTTAPISVGLPPFKIVFGSTQ